MFTSGAADVDVAIPGGTQVHGDGDGRSERRRVAWRSRPGTTPGRTPDRAPVVLLHGGLSDGRTFDALARHLTPDRDLWTFDRRGHGRTPDSPAAFSYADMVAETVAVLRASVGGPVHLVGHSDGADLALLLAISEPAAVSSVSAFSANLDPSGYQVGSVTVAQMVAAVGPAYAEVSPDGIGHLPVVVGKVLDLWATEPTMTPADVGRITCPVLVAAGSADVVRREHTELIAASIPGAQLAIVPDTSHMAIEEAPAACAALVEDCITRALS